MTYHLHFGVLPLDLFGEASVQGHTDPEREFHFPIWPWGREDFPAIVSGSWEVWGPADQAEDPVQTTLHVLVEVPHRLHDREALDLRSALWSYVGEGCRLVDYALLTPADDWSRVTAVYAFTSSPECVRFETTR